MQIALVPVPGVDVGDRRVGGVGDHVAADAVAERDVALPPRQRGPSAIGLDAEVGGDEVLERLLPDGVAVVIDDQGARRRRRRRVVGREQDQPGSDSSAEGRDRQRGDPQVGAAHVAGHRWRRRERHGAAQHARLRGGDSERGRRRAPGEEQLAATQLLRDRRVHAIESSHIL